MNEEDTQRAIWNKTHKAYSKEHREVCRDITNNYRNELTDDQKVIGIADTTLMTFKKEKLIKIIRKLERMIEG